MSQLNDDLLANLDIVEVVGRYVQLKRTGRNFVWFSPFKQERTPSFVVSPDKQIFKCFATWIWWNAIKFIMEVDKLQYRDAIQQLAQQAGLDLSKYSFWTQDQQKQYSQMEKLKLLNKHAQSFFVQQLEKYPEVKKYLTVERQLDDKTIKQFGLGYAPDNYYELVEFLKWKGFDLADMQLLGLAKKSQSNELYSFFRHRIMFPVFDHMWTIVGFAGRAIKKDDNPKYLNSPESALYDKSKILYGLHVAKENYTKHNKELIVVEWYMDVIGLTRGGLPIWIASCGTSLTAAHINLIKRYTQTVIFAFDNDQAWFEATIRGLKIAYENDIFPKIMILDSQFKDIDELINAHTGSDGLQLTSVDAFDFVSKKLETILDINNPVERKRYISQMFELFAHISDRSIWSFYIEKLADRLKTNPQFLFTQFKEYLQSGWKFIHRETKKEIDEAKSEKYTTAALLYSNFYTTLWETTELLTESIKLLLEISEYFPESFLFKVTKNNLSESEIQTLKESQLIWENQLWMLEPQKVSKEITAFLKARINSLSKMVLKLNNVSPEIKQELLKKIQKISK